MLVIVSTLPLWTVGETAGADWYHDALEQAALLEPEPIEDLEWPSWDLESALETQTPVMAAEMPDEVRAFLRAFGAFKSEFVAAEEAGDSERMQALLEERFQGLESSFAIGQSSPYVSGLGAILALLSQENDINRLAICHDVIVTYCGDDRIKAHWARLMPATLTQLKVDLAIIADGAAPPHWEEAFRSRDEHQAFERMFAEDPGRLHAVAEAAFARSSRNAMRHVHTCPTAWDAVHDFDDSLPRPVALMAYYPKLHGQSYWRGRVTAFVLREAAALAVGDIPSTDACLGELMTVAITDGQVTATAAELPTIAGERHPLQGQLEFIQGYVEPVEREEVDVDAMLEELQRRREELKSRDRE